MFDTKLCKSVLSPTIIQELIADFESGCDHHLVGRRFNVNIERAKELLTPIIKEHLPGEWVIDGGNYFETVRPYRLHCDSGKDEVKRLYYNIVIPLQLWATDYKPELNKLIVTDQTWSGDAAFFIKGDVGQNEYNVCVQNYADVGNITDTTEQYLLENCGHLNPQNLEGFTTKASLEWCPGDIMLFRRDLVHVTTDWRKAGVERKLGLSLFTSYIEPGSV
jgi:hypothetical protein